MYYLILLLLFGYFVVYHFPQMNSISPSSESPSVDPIDQAEELADGKFYHHPVWEKRWYHPEFTEEAAKNWAKEAWYKDPHRTSQRFLSSRFLSDFPWGFIIYRTTYTPESEKLWPLVMERLANGLINGIDCEAERYPNDTRPEQLVKESHKDVVISDASRWDGASIEEVREHFLGYLRKMNQERSSEEARFASCLVIDERSLQSIISEDKSNRFVGLVDGRYNPEKEYDWPSYRGYMRVYLSALWSLYENFEYDTVDKLCPDVADGLIPVYDAMDGTAHDEEGNVISRDVRRRRPMGLLPPGFRV
ncbi:hypothetical protein N7528_007362 [Penicillium herquei]|nr:hypothetical protein N7528_007362 [Penicillium herquei]